MKEFFEKLAKEFAKFNVQQKAAAAILTLSLPLCLGMGVSAVSSNSGKGPDPEVTPSPSPTIEATAEPTATPTPSPTPKKDKKISLIPASIEEDLEVQIVDRSGNLVLNEKFVLHVKCAANGYSKKWTVDGDGFLRLPTIPSGKYTVSIEEVEGYIVPDEPVTVEVKKKVEYKEIDVSDQVVDSSQVNEKEEDAAYGSVSTATPPPVQNTVEYVESTKTEVKTTYSYTADLAEGNRIKDKNGKATDYVAEVKDGVIVKVYKLTYPAVSPAARALSVEPTPMAMRAKRASAFNLTLTNMNLTPEKTDDGIAVIDEETTGEETVNNPGDGDNQGGDSTPATSPHTHDEAGTRGSDSEGCWPVCSCGEPGEKVGHVYDNDQDANCNRCNYAREVHVHDTNGTRGQDDNQCWPVCSCGVPGEKVNHTYDNDQDTDCNLCGHTRTVASLKCDHCGGEHKTDAHPQCGYCTEKNHVTEGHTDDMMGCKTCTDKELAKTHATKDHATATAPAKDKCGHCGGEHKTDAHLQCKYCDLKTHVTEGHTDDMMGCKKCTDKALAKTHTTKNHATAIATPSPSPTPTPTPTPSPTPVPTPTKTEVTDFFDKEGKINSKYAGLNLKITEKSTVTYKYTGWQTIDGGRYFYDKNGNKVTGTQTIQGITYHFDSNGVMSTQRVGIDVSKYQGNINWSAVKEAGIEFAIIRVGYRGYGTGKLVWDNYFAQNIKNATAAGLKVGVYIFSQAIDTREAVEEASMCLEGVRGYNLAYPIFFDTEYSTSRKDGRADHLTRDQRTRIAQAFCETIRNAGYKAGIYASSSWFNNQLSYGEISQYEIWVAHYTSAGKPGFNQHYDIWQYTGSGTCAGVPGAVDMNIGYTFY